MVIINFSNLIDLRKKDKKQYIKKSSYAAYALLIENHLLQFFGKMESIEEEDLQQFVLTKLEAGLSQKTIKDILIVFKMIYKFGVKHKVFDYKDFDIKFPTNQKSNELEVLNRNHQRKIMEYVENNFTFKNFGIYLCLSTGIRIGEVCALTWNDIDVDSGIISINKTIERIYIIDGGERHTELIIDTPKTKNSIRDIPMTNDLMKLAKSLKKLMNGSYYILTNDEKPTEPRTYRNYYNRLMVKLDLPKLKFHGLRHSFATRCIEGKCDYKTVSVILGHSNISTTLNLYVHPNLEQKKKCIDQMRKSLK